VADLLGNIGPLERAIWSGLHYSAYPSLILRIKFVPEPSGWGVLIAGAGFLLVLYWLQGRGSRLLQVQAKS
jgi:hypothetical protein